MLWHNPAGFQDLVHRLSAAVNKVVVVLYLRRQADFLESNYIERLKSRLCLDFAGYLPVSGRRTRRRPGAPSNNSLGT
jgi:hypothetical protein